MRAMLTPEYQFESRLGGTRYLLTKPQVGGPNNVEVKRINEKVTTIYIPEDLLIQFAKHWLLRQMPDLISRMK
jgi:hypothetical protein